MHGVKCYNSRFANTRQLLFFSGSSVFQLFFFVKINTYFSKVLQILGDFVPQTRGFAPGPH